MSEHQSPVQQDNNGPLKKGAITSIVKLFTTSSLSPMLIIAALLAGIAALLLTPREEDPQIVVPVMDVMVELPGASAEEVEKLVTTPLESLLKQIEGVKYVYSAASPGQAIVTVRYYVGENLEDSLVKTWSKIMSNQDMMAPGISRWIVKPINIDDVPIVLLSLSSKSPNQNQMSLRRTADELLAQLRHVDNVAKSWVVGGAHRQITIHPNTAALVAHNVTLTEIIQAIGSTNINVNAGNFANAQKQIYLDVGPFYNSAEEVGATVIKSSHGRLLYLREVAEIIDGPEDNNSYTRIGFGPAVEKMHKLGPQVEVLEQFAGQEWPTVTVAVAKRKGSNAVQVSKDVIKLAESFQGSLVARDILLSVSRDSGDVANKKANELVEHLLSAVFIVILLLVFSLGTRESLIVSIAVPVTFAFTLLCDLVFGYTINRVTLFALILSLGLLVDDPIVNVENIHRHYQLRKESSLNALLSAIQEVLPPTIVATFAVILTFLPMLFITGMMGPYMAPMAFNVPVAMLISLLVSLTITPWASYRFLKRHDSENEPAFDIKSSAIYRFYQKTLGALIVSPKRAYLFILIIVIAFIAASMLAVTRTVPLKLLPFDNKNELQLVIDMPKSSTLEQTDEVARSLGQYLATIDEVTDYQTYIGLASPMDFNGMVRHYYLRQGSTVGEIRVNLVDKKERQHQSHQIALRIRNQIQQIAKQYNANIKIVESPPGPPVLATLVAEVYGPEDASYDELIEVSKDIRKRFEQTTGVVDVDDYSFAPYQHLLFQINREKAALTGVSVQQITATIQTALTGKLMGTLHIASEREPLKIQLQLPRHLRSYTSELLTLRVKSNTGALVPLSELGRLVEIKDQQVIYHKNLQRVTYVIGETVGRSPVDAIVDLIDDFDNRPLAKGYNAELSGEGEWKITVDVFRDLGIAFAAALLMIYVLLVVQTGSLGLPAIMMIAIPLTVIGIMPGFWLLNVFFTEPVDGYADQIFFTATAMIGMIALAGIVVRNGIILIDFIELIRKKEGVTSLEEALIEAGATRTRPILLTAGSAMLGSMVIILDPVFSGLAWSFIFGTFASTAFSLFVIPVAYYLINKDKNAGPIS